MPELTHQQKITLGEMRSSGVRGILVYCADYNRCAQAVRIGGDRWPDHIRLSDLEPLFICQACGRRGADIRPDLGLGTIATTREWLATRDRQRALGTCRLLGSYQSGLRKEILGHVSPP